MGRVRTGRLIAATAAVLVLVGCATTGPPPSASWHFETNDGAGGTNGRTNGDVGTDTASTASADGVTHVFTYDASLGDLRHGWWNGSTWRFEGLDGAGGGNGRVDADVGQFATTASYLGVPHVWYYDTTNGNLRHAWWAGSAWRFEVLDGAGGANGRTNADVGLHARAQLYNGTTHVFFYDANAGTLRHAWWNGTGWWFEALDGAGGGAGRTGNAVGQDIAVVAYLGAQHVFFYDATAGNLRHAWFANWKWSFETLDGAGGLNGRLNVDTGQYNGAVVHAGELHVFSHDASDGDLRHEWWGAGAWHFETLDGNSTAGGRTTNVVGTDITAFEINGRNDIWYSDESAGVLRHAWWTGTAWKYENLDGLGGANGRIDAVVGQFTSGLVDGRGQAQLWYFADAGDLRHAWLA